MSRISKQTRYIESGFTLVELLVSVTIVGILAAVAIPNFEQFKTRAFDSVALSDYRNLKTVMYGNNINSNSNFILFNQLGPLNLPAPISEGVLSKNDRLFFAIHLNVLNILDIIALRVGHEKGGHSYQLVEINGNRTELVIDNP